MFTASYSQFCRELRLEREFEEGDWFLWFYPENGGRDERSLLRIATRTPEPKRSGKHNVWLPTLTDWLFMLEEAYQASPDFEEMEAYEPVRIRVLSALADHARTYVDSLSWEEVAARLWCAATGRPDV